VADAAAEAAAIRQAIADERYGDPRDPDLWPDLSALPATLLPVLEVLRTEVDWLRARGYPTVQTITLASSVEASRNAIIRLGAIDALARWRVLHPKVIDGEDGAYWACGNPDCDGVDDAHRSRWGLT